MTRVISMATVVITYIRGRIIITTHEPPSMGGCWVPRLYGAAVRVEVYG